MEVMALPIASSVWPKGHLRYHIASFKECPHQLRPSVKAHLPPLATNETNLRDKFRARAKDTALSLNSSLAGKFRKMVG